MNDERDLSSIRYWTWAEWLSLSFHVLLAGVPLAIATYESWSLWYILFGNSIMPTALVLIVEVPAISMFIFYLANVPSRFLRLRHFIPIVSSVALAYGMHNLLQHNNPYVAWSVTVIVATIIMLVSAAALGSIEDLFVSPVEAATRLSRKQTRDLENTLALISESLVITDNLVQRHNGTLRAVAQRAGLLPGPTPALQVLHHCGIERDELSDETRLSLTVPNSVCLSGVDVEEGAVIMPAPEPEQTQSGRVSKSEIIRQEKRGGASVADICAKYGWERGTVAPIYSKAKG